MDLVILTPEWTLAAFALVIILFDLFVEDKKILPVLAIIGLIVSAGVSIAFSADYSIGISKTAFGGMLILDNFSLFFKLLFAGISML